MSCTCSLYGLLGVIKHACIGPTRSVPLKKVNFEVLRFTIINLSVCLTVKTHKGLSGGDGKRHEILLSLEPRFLGGWGGGRCGFSGYIKLAYCSSAKGLQ